MDEQAIINQVVDKYHRLEGILRNRILSDEKKAFLQGRMLELILLIYTLDEQALVRLAELSGDTES